MKNIQEWVMAVTFVFVATSCATFDNIEAGLNSLVGRDITDAINVLGYPNGEREVVGKKIYTWHTSQFGSYSLPQTSYDTGYVGSVPFSYTATTYTTQIYHYQCNIDLIVEDGGQIISWQLAGNVGGCSLYESRLRPLAKQYESRLTSLAKQRERDNWKSKNDEIVYCLFGDGSVRSHLRRGQNQCKNEGRRKGISGKQISKEEFQQHW